MLLNVLVSLPLIVTLVAIPAIPTETTSSTTDAISTEATSGSNLNVTRDQEEKWPSDELDQQNYQPVEKVIGRDSPSLHKYRRDGTESLAKRDNQNRYFLDFVQQYQHQNELNHPDKNQNGEPSQYQPIQQYQQQQRRYRDEIHPVTVQACNHVTKNVTRPSTETNSQFPYESILQDWLAGSEWSSSRSHTANDDKRYENSYLPVQVTTANPKIAAYRNDGYNRYDLNDNKSVTPFRTRYNLEADMATTRNYHNLQFHDIQHNSPAGTQPYLTPPPLQPPQQQHHDRHNNPITYYEYDSMANHQPSSGRCHTTHPNCGLAHTHYNNRWPATANSGRHPSYFNDRYWLQSPEESYYQNKPPLQPYRSSMEGATNEDYRKQAYNGHAKEDAYRY